MFRLSKAELSIVIKALDSYAMGIQDTLQMWENDGIPADKAVVTELELLHRAWRKIEVERRN